MEGEGGSGYRNFKVISFNVQSGDKKSQDLSMAESHCTQSDFAWFLSSNFPREGGRGPSQVELPSLDATEEEARNQRTVSLFLLVE